MTRYQLSISPRYIKSWGINEALREIFQNAIDQSKSFYSENPEDHSLSPEGLKCMTGIVTLYDPIAYRLTVGNENTTIPRRSLLLGETTKTGSNTIGKYGEGYKLALLVLTRAGLRTTVINGKEKWTPKIVNSRSFDGEVLVIDIEKLKPESTALLFVIDGLTPEMYSSFQDKCLLFKPSIAALQGASIGRLLTDPKQKGRIYASGLYVQTNEELAYGYDLAPGHIELDRDRKKVDTFNLTWELGRLLAGLPSEHRDLINKMVSDSALDVQFYATHASGWSPTYREICDMQYQAFLEKHGKLAVVCKDEEEMETIKKKYGNLVPVVLPERQYKFISESSAYKASPAPSTLADQSPHKFIEDFITKALEIQYYYEETFTWLKTTLLEESKNWRYK